MKSSLAHIFIFLLSLQFSYAEVNAADALNPLGPLGPLVEEIQQGVGEVVGEAVEAITNPAPSSASGQATLDECRASFIEVKTTIENVLKNNCDKDNICKQDGSVDSGAFYNSAFQDLNSNRADYENQFIGCKTHDLNLNGHEFKITFPDNKPSIEFIEDNIIGYGQRNCRQICSNQRDERNQTAQILANEAASAVTLKRIANMSEQVENFGVGNDRFERCLSLTQNGTGYDFSNIEFKPNENKVTLIDHEISLPSREYQNKRNNTIQNIKQSLYQIGMGCKVAVDLYMKDEEHRNDDIDRKQHVAKTDPTIVCNSYGRITKDYKACKEIADWIDGFNYGKQGTAIVQQTLNQTGIQQDQARAFEETATGNNITPGLDAMKSSLDRQTSFNVQNAAISAAQFATLESLLSSYPLASERKKECESFDSSTLIQDINSIPNSSPSFANSITDEEEIKQNCLLQVNVYTRGMYANQGILASLKNQKYAAAMDAATQGALAALNAKLAGDVGKRIESLRDIEENAFEDGGFDPDLVIDPCLADPSAVGCSDGLITPGSLITPLGGATSPGVDGTISSNLDGGFEEGIPDIADSTTGAITPAALVEVEDKLGNEMEALAGSRPLNVAGEGGGGGGGGAAGGGGGAGGGGVSADDFQEQQKQTPRGNLKSPSYAGTSKRISGGKRNSRNKRKSPFDKRAAAKKALVNFGRLPASVSRKGTNIFNRVSAQYQKAQEKKRLLEYEVK